MRQIQRAKKLSKQAFLKRITRGSLPTDRALLELTDRLHHYEKRYNMRSEVFYKLIVGTPAEDHPDFLSWAMCYRSYFRILKTKFSLEEVLASAF